ncbi:thermonuclease family protein [Listeria booriae]|uniref:thermonuclease family protein n=1 Tax=Listeria booriae TaxID=1552123 RepID=UPI00164DCF5B|nr:thermonuclease family protein [Listeria booriae]MBC6301547.1 thermonuclease family protein [Listeria booriae]
MRKYLLSLSLILTLLLASCSVTLSPPTISEPTVPDTVAKYPETDSVTPTPALKKIDAHVLRVLDGDTFEVITASKEKKTVRMLLIDTPESVHPSKPVMPYGKEASDFAKELLTDKDVTLEYDVGDQKDKYGRDLCYVYLLGVSVQGQLLEMGLGIISYVYEPNTTHLESFQKSQETARKTHVGVWSQDGYVLQSGNGYRYSE